MSFIKQDHLDAMVKSISELAKRDVLVGIPDSAPERDDGQLSSAQIGYIQEFGGQIEHPGGTKYTVGENGARFVSNDYQGQHQVTEAHTIVIPPRPFLVPGVQDANKKATEELGKAADAALDGNLETALNYMSRAGVVAQDSVKSRIHNGPHMPLAPSTLAKRRAKGRTGDRPLEDTGQLRNSITYVIRKK